MEQTVGTKPVFNKCENSQGSEKNMVREETPYFDIKSRLGFLDEDDFTNVSMRFLNENGYFREGEIIKLCDFVDLLVQARVIVLNNKKYGYENHYVYAGKIFTANEEIKEIFIVSNDSGKSTIKLPTDA